MPQRLRTLQSRGRFRGIVRLFGIEKILHRFRAEARHLLMDGRPLGAEHAVETGELRAYSVAQRLFKVQPRHDVLRHLSGNRRVTVKMSDALLVKRPAQGLTEVMEEHRPSQLPLWRHGGDSARRVTPDVEAVVVIALVKADAG